MLSVVLLTISENFYYLEDICSKVVDKNGKRDNNRYKCLFSRVSATLLTPCRKANVIQTDTLTKLLTGLIKFCFSRCIQ